jgi:hemolysin III
VPRSEPDIQQSVTTGPGELVLPQWRGRLHTWAFFATLPLGMVLLLLADRPAARVAVAVYVACLAALFGVSATYHRLARSPTARRRLRRLDHSLIFMLIAGTYTPVCVLALPEHWGIPLLVVVWAGAVAGVALKNIRGFHAANSLYLVLGWAAIAASPAIIHNLPVGALALMLAGGVAYTAGAVVLFRGRPDPSPARFGYHEVWHACTLAASACHFAMVALIVFASARA